MMGVVIEAGLLAIPPTADSEAEVEEIIERLIAWSSIVIGNDIFKVCQMSDTTEVLGACNAWPSSGNVEALLDLYGLRGVYSSQEVSRLINTIIERSMSVQEAMGVEVVECTAIREPAVTYQNPVLQAAGRRAFATLSSGFERSPMFLALAARLSVTIADWQGEVTQIFSDEATARFVTPPFSVIGRVKLLVKPECVVDHLSAERIWERAIDSIGLHFGILLKMKEIMAAAGQSVGLNALPSFSIGSEFYNSLQCTQSSGHGRFSSVVLETCARVILGNPKYSIDPFTKGPRSQNDEQWVRASDGASGFRTHVTKSGEGLRLFLWKNQNGVLELSKIALHNDQNVCDGALANCVFKSW